MGRFLLYQTAVTSDVGDAIVAALEIDHADVSELVEVPQGYSLVSAMEPAGFGRGRVRRLAATLANGLNSNPIKRIPLSSTT